MILSSRSIGNRGGWVKRETCFSWEHYFRLGKNGHVHYGERIIGSCIEAVMNELNPVHYTVHLEPDLKAWTFSGRIEIRLEAPNAVKEIILNAKELSILSCTVQTDQGPIECPFSLDAHEEVAAISLPKEMDGAIIMAISFMGEINDRMVGLYRSRYLAEGETRYCAITQFQENDARRAFPCLDQPLKKATFAVELVIPEPLAAISNMPVEDESPAGEGRKRVRFRQTPKMSTYLLFIGVGEFEFIQDEAGSMVRAAAMPGMAKHARLGLEFGKKALLFCEDYYGVRYPLPKLDLVAIPDFASGAMENWGAITFRENLLLHYSDTTSKAGRQRIYEVIAHEIVHQWFGNFVTPSDWIYLWLNESFATYFGHAVVAHYYPSWEIWSQFLYSRTKAALHRDALHETFPIELPGGQHAAINASTAPIIYNKGAGILRFLAGFIGEDAFRQGLQRYLRKYAYSCTTSRNLWEEFEEISEKPVVSMMKTWVEQPGFPLLEVRRQDHKLFISQKRFTYLANTFGQQWMVPVEIEIFTSRQHSRKITFLLDSEAAVIDIGKDVAAYKINSGQAGFYRVKYHDTENLAELRQLAGRNVLPPEDRWGLQDDLYSLLKCKNVSLDEYLELLSSYQTEEAFLPLIGIAANLYHAYLVFRGAQRAKIASFGKSFLETILSRIGYEPKQDETYPHSILRDAVLAQAAVYGSQTATEFARSVFSRLSRGDTIHPDIAKSVLHISALHGDEETFAWLKHRLMSSVSEHERLNILAAMGGFRDTTVIELVRNYILMEVPSRNKFIPITSMAENPDALPSLWDWFVSHLGRMERFHPAHFDRVIEAIIPIAGIDQETQVRAFLEKYMREKDKARDVIRMSLEKLRINSNMRQGE